MPDEDSRFYLQTPHWHARSFEVIANASPTVLSYRRYNKKESIRPKNMQSIPTHTYIHVLWTLDKNATRVWQARYIYRE